MLVVNQQSIMDWQLTTYLMMEMPAMPDDRWWRTGDLDLLSSFLVWRTPSFMKTSSVTKTASMARSGRENQGKTKQTTTTCVTQNMIDIATNSEKNGIRTSTERAKDRIV